MSIYLMVIKSEFQIFENRMYSVKHVISVNDARLYVKLKISMKRK